MLWAKIAILRCWGDNIELSGWNLGEYATKNKIIITLCKNYGIDLLSTDLIKSASQSIKEYILGWEMEEKTRILWVLFC